ncbi:CopM family metallochaperone [Kushneria sp. Sum13]|uniref:CopM family metallochaperone n=1 Tax=Kushneria sp. Sum13 TaxID=3459196 RepID=UPI0040456CF4
MFSKSGRGMSLVAGLLMSGVALAEAPATHEAHGSSAGEADQAAHAFSEANQRMHHDMAISTSGNVDMDFARGMLAHHRGAVDMARIELEHGSDEQMRSLARNVIDAQQREIDQLERWIAEHDDSPDSQKAK